MCQKAAQEWRIIMGILTRFKDIMSANINALLDKCEDPEKMIDQYMRNMFMKEICFTCLPDILEIFREYFI